MSVRKTFDAELEELMASLIKMSSLAVEAINNSVRAFERHDLTLAASVVQGDREVEVAGGKA